MSYADRQKAVGFILDNDRYALSFGQDTSTTNITTLGVTKGPKYDTTYVCFLSQPGHPWAMYAPFSFKDATFYENDDDYILNPPEKVVFCRAASDMVYQWDTTTGNNGPHFTATYKTGLNIVTQKRAEVTKSLFIRESGDVNGQVAINFYNENGAALGSYTVKDTGNQIQRLGSINGDEAMGFQIKITADTLTDSLKVEAMDVFYQLFDVDWR
jgi:hypothetical protein